MKRSDCTPERIRALVRRRMVWRIVALILMEIAGVAFMKFYGENYFETRLGGANAPAAYAVLAVAPILLCGILYDIIDRDWSGEIRKIYTSVVKKWSPDDSADQNTSSLSLGTNNRYRVSVNVRDTAGQAAEHSLGIILDSDLDRMAEGDTITHYRGTHLYHVVSRDGSHPDHYIGKL